MYQLLIVYLKIFKICIQLWYCTDKTSPGCETFRISALGLYAKEDLKSKLQRENQPQMCNFIDQHSLLMAVMKHLTELKICCFLEINSYDFMCTSVFI